MCLSKSSCSASSDASMPAMSAMTPPRRAARPAPLLALALMLGTAVQAQPAGTPRQIIDALGLEQRQLLHKPDPKRSPEDAERDAAAQIKALIGTSPGHLSLTEADSRGRTPLMLAAGQSYALIVEALLSDPGVRLSMDVADADGETAWMLASFALPMTLPACQPGSLTVERQLQMLPYLRRLAHLAKTKAASVTATIDALEAAGVQPRPDDAKRAWLARCPNAAPDLRRALAEGELMPTLVNTATTRLAEYVRATRDAPRKVPLRPPAGMRFVPDEQRRTAVRLVPQFAAEVPGCPRVVRPRLDNPLAWKGMLRLKAVVWTRGGVVEAVDVDQVAINGRQDDDITNFFRDVTLRALAGYECEGDFVFEQEFQFEIR